MKFLNFFKSTAGIIIIILVVLALILVFMNWDSIKAWWNTPSVPPPGNPGPGTVENTRLGTQLASAPIFDNNGNPTGGYTQIQQSVDARSKVPCQKVTNVVNGISYTGWIGDCKYPIGAQ